MEDHNFNRRRFLQTAPGLVMTTVAVVNGAAVVVLATAASAQPSTPARGLDVNRAIVGAFVNFKFPEGTVDVAKKVEIVHRMTQMFVDYLGEGARPYCMVLIDEVADGGWGRADEVMTLAKMGLPPKANSKSPRP